MNVKCCLFVVKRPCGTLMSCVLPETTGARPGRPVGLPPSERSYPPVFVAGFQLHKGRRETVRQLGRRGLDSSPDPGPRSGRSMRQTPRSARPSSWRLSVPVGPSVGTVDSIHCMGTKLSLSVQSLSDRHPDKNARVLVTPSPLAVCEANVC